MLKVYIWFILGELYLVLLGYIIGRISFTRSDCESLEDSFLEDIKMDFADKMVYAAYLTVMPILVAIITLAAGFARAKSAIKQFQPKRG